MKIWERLFKKHSASFIPEMQEERFVLCIDGGGMRGVIPIAVLQLFEKELKEKGVEKNLASCFDLIAGTSTGGLIALSLAYKKDASLEELMNTYMTSGNTIFPAEPVSLFGIRRLISDKYPASGIESVLDSWFGDKKMSETDVPVMAVSYDLSIGKEALIRSWVESDFSVKKAGRATTAAPTYFAPLAMGSSLLADGGVIANNPALFAYQEAKALYPNCRKFHILSISTGAKNHTMESNQTSGLLSWAEDIVPLYSTAQKRMTDYLMYGNPEVSYTRIDAPLSESIKMDDTSVLAMEILKNFGKNMAEEFKELLSDFAEKIALHQIRQNS